MPEHQFSQCPFCGETTDFDLEEDPTEGACGDITVWVKCSTCEATGPRTRIGCRDEEDENAPADEDWRPVLEREAVEEWNNSHEALLLAAESVHRLTKERDEARAALHGPAPKDGTSQRCAACQIEAEIGTEDDPHPVPRRFHVCSASSPAADVPKDGA